MPASSSSSSTSSNNPTPTPSTLANMFSRMKSQLTSSTDSAAPPSPSKRSTRTERSEANQASTQLQSRIPVAVSSPALARTAASHAVPPSPSRERSQPQVQQYTSQTQSHHVQQNAQANPTMNNSMPPPPAPTQSAYSLHPQQDQHFAQSVALQPQEDLDIHMTTVNPSMIDPRMLQQLANQPAHTSLQGTSAGVPVPNIKDQRIDIDQYLQHTQNQQQRGGAPVGGSKMQALLKSGNGGSPGPSSRTAAPKPAPKEQSVPGQLEMWEREILASAEVKRKATLAQLYFLDYYFDLLGYLHARKGRLSGFKADIESRELTQEEASKEYRSYAGRERVVLRKRRIKLRVEQFRIIAQVGQGGYGSVYLARKADTGQVCALKKMKKTTLAKMDEVKHVLIERDILTATKTPWLVSLLYAFQDRDHVYLAMEYVPGGDFRTLLNNSGVLKEEHARFYSAEMFMGVSELHKLGYIHRDLKPENFLVDSTGHVKLTDFGLATGALNPQKIESMKNKLDQVKDENLVLRSTLERRTMYKSMRMAEPRYADSVVGSPDYMPPEVLRGKTYTFSADYWSLGCILFEFLCGFPPFSGSTPDETWVNLKNWHKVLRRPVYDKPEDLIFNLTDSAWDAVVRLIAHPKDRVATISEIQSLPFYTPLAFSTLRQTSAPFVPMLDSDIDVGYFDSFNSPEDMAKYAEVFKKQADVEAVKERGKGERNAWVGFTFGRNANPVPTQPARRKPENEALHTMF